MLKLANECNVALAVSLHAPTDELRDKLVPINKVHPIAELLDACWKYAEGHASRSITFEYVLLDGVNDSVAHARARDNLLRNRPAKVNLIPFNAFPESEFRCSSQPAIDEFWQTLRNGGNDRDDTPPARRRHRRRVRSACGPSLGPSARPSG